MENAYHIGVTNRYQLFLNDEEDPLEMLKIQEEAKEARKKSKQSEKENKVKPENKGQKSQPIRKGIKETQNLKPTEPGKGKEENKGKPPARMLHDRTDRNVKFAESREERNNRRNREDKSFFNNANTDFHREPREPKEREQRENFRTNEKGDHKEIRAGDDRPPRGRGAPRGLGRGRGGRGRGGYDMRGKREFDRQSGSDKTGVKPVDKRDGGGAHNWGSHRDDLVEHFNQSQVSHESGEWNVDKTEDTPAPEPAETKETEVEGAETEATVTTDEEPREYTLDEYYARKGNRQKPTYNLRKAGEGEDLSQWKKMYELQRKKEGDDEEESDEEYDVSEYPQRVGRQKHVLDIDIHFADSRRGGRGRGRGGVRGSRGGVRGGVTRPGPIGRVPGTEPRGERPDVPRTTKQSAPKVDDEHDFPSLG